MEEKRITEHESLQLIQQMISIAKKEQKDDGRGWIIWGWMLFLSSVLSAINLHTRWFDTFFFWNLFGIITIIAFIYETVSKYVLKRVERVKTYTGDLFTKLNAGFFICLVFIIVSINLTARAMAIRYGVHDIIVNNGFALLINVYAFWILIYGTALNFRPSVIGAYCTWVVGFVALFAKNFEQVMWLHALAVLIGYIIPGHIANREFKKFKSKDKLVESV